LTAHEAHINLRVVHIAPKRTAEAELRVLFADPSAIEPDAARAAYLGVLNDAERTQHGKFRFDDDRHTYLIAHALVRFALAGELGVDAASLRFEIGEHGKPELIEGQGVRFNLSHTRGLVACAITRTDDVGVDVEHVDRKTEIDSLARSVLSEAERASLATLEGSARRERFFRYWTLKEAYVKAMGRGIALPLRSLHVELGSAPADAPRFVFHPPFEDDARVWSLASRPLLVNHVLGVAIRRPDPPRLSIEGVVPGWEAAKHA
jgi:4'-phosphopantetheinyl transferase